MVTKLDHRRVLKHPAWIDHQLAVLQRIDITLDQQQIGARFHGKESAARDVDAVRAFEVFDGCTRRRLELDDGLAVVQVLLVDDDLQIQVLGLHHPLESRQIEPKVIGVEDLEFADRLELFQVLRGYLGDLEQANGTLIINKGTTLSVTTWLI